MTVVEGSMWPSSLRSIQRKNAVGRIQSCIAIEHVAGIYDIYSAEESCWTHIGVQL
jgi:hypothetical protein